MSRMPRLGLFVVMLSVVLAAGACELSQITLVDSSDVAVAEVYVVVESDPTQNRIQAFLHGTVPGSPVDTETFDDATVTVRRQSGTLIGLTLRGLAECVASLPESSTGSCFVGDGPNVQSLATGEGVQLDIVLGDGRTLASDTRIPRDFALEVADSCQLPPDTLMDIRWSLSSGAWAYVGESSTVGLSAALAPEGIVTEDTLHLLALAISEDDREVVFPSEFGVFDRFDLERDLSLRLQRGLPDQTTSDISIAAVDRNYTNWARGGSFNPSGEVRVSSVTGDGTGVFGAVALRRLRVITSSAAIPGVATCPLSTG